MDRWPDGQVFTLLVKQKSATMKEMFLLLQFQRWSNIEKNASALTISMYSMLLSLMI